MRIILFLITAVLFAPFNFAESITVSFENRVYAPGSDISLEFALNSCSNDFRIRFVVDKGKVEIFNPKSLKWVGANEVWNQYPMLEKKMKIRVVHVDNERVELRVELQNIRLGAVSSSEITGVWLSDALKDYIDKLNATVLNNVKAK